MKQDPGEIVKIKEIIAEHSASGPNTDLHMCFEARVMAGWSDPDAI